MATKKCPNGHYYDSSIYGDKCPFCPSSQGTEVNANPMHGSGGGKTQILGGGGATVNLNAGGEEPTVQVNNPNMHNDNGGGGPTVIRHANPSGATDLSSGGGRRLVGLLVSYDINPNGEAYKIYEGRNIIGRAATCDIPVPNDNNMSSQHLLILYREAEGVFWAADQNSSNGTYVNGAFVSDRVKLSTNDLIVVGATKFVFLAIPQ